MSIHNSGEIIMHIYTSFLKLVIFVTAFTIGSGVSAGEQEGGFPVLSHDQYQKSTGCSVNQDLYERSVRQVIASVIFKDEPVVADDTLEEFTQDLQYTRRHSRDFFGPLMQLHEEGSPCAPDSLVKLAEAAGFPEKSDMPVATDAITPPSSYSTPYVLMTRAQYMEATSCLVSPSTFEHYRVAFILYVLSYTDDDDKAKVHLTQFLQETGEGKRSARNTLAAACMTPTITRLAKELSLLNEKGEYQLK